MQWRKFGNFQFLPAILAPLLALALLAGCIDTPTKEDRLACLELSSYSFSYVPDCGTQEKCFALADAAFAFNSKTFAPSIAQELFFAKSHISRAWLFLNNARENLKKTHSLCESAQNFSQIPQLSNELESNLLVVGSEIDLFSESAARSISLEAQELEAEDVNLMPQSALFDDYILLNQNIADFSQKNLQGATYASQYLQQAEKFRAVSQAISPGAQVQEKNAYGLIAQNQSSVLGLARIKEKDFPVAILAPLFQRMGFFLSDFYSLQGSVAALKKIPAAPMFGALNSILGSENSAAGAFFAIFANDSAHRIELLAQTASGQQAAAKTLADARLRLDALSKNYGGSMPAELLAGAFDSNSSAYGAGEEGGVFSTTLPLGSLESFESSLGERIDSANSGLRSISQAQFLHTQSLGRISRSIFDAGAQAREISSGLDTLEKSFSRVNEACSQELGAIKEKLASVEFGSRSQNPVAVSLRARIESRISSFEKSAQYDGCAQAIRFYHELETYLDSAQDEQAGAGLIDACILSIGRLLPLDVNSQFGPQLDSLKRIARPYQNPELVLRSCSDLHGRLLFQARSLPEIANAQEGYVTLSSETALLKGVVENFPSLPSEGKARTAISSYDSLSGFFDGGNIREEFLGEEKAQEIKGKIFQLLEGMGQLLQSIAGQAASKYAKIELLQGQNRALGKSLASISLLNKGPGLPFSFSAPVNIDSFFAGEVFSTGNISFVPEGKQTVLVFSSLLSGLNSIILDLNANAPGVTAAKSDGDVGVPDRNAGQILEARVMIAAQKALLLQKASGLNSENIPVLEEWAQKIDSLSRQGKIAQAQEALGELSLKISRLQSGAQESEVLAQKANGALEKAKALAQLGRSLQEKTALLSENFSQLRSDELSQVYAFSPLTKERLAQMKKTGESAFGKGSPGEKIGQLVFEGKEKEAAGLAEKIGLDGLLEAVRAADEEAGGAIEKLKENALSSYSVAISKSDSSKSTPELDAKLLSAKEGLEEKSYLKSILNSQQAMGLGAAILARPEIPFAVYPIILLIAGAGLYIYHKGSGRKAQPAQIRVSRADEPAAEEEEKET